MAWRDPPTKVSAELPPTKPVVLAWFVLPVVERSIGAFVVRPMPEVVPPEVLPDEVVVRVDEDPEPVDPVDPVPVEPD